jgi:hypothetical protein
MGFLFHLDLESLTKLERLRNKLLDRLFVYLKLDLEPLTKIEGLRHVSRWIYKFTSSKEGKSTAGTKFHVKLGATKSWPLMASLGIHDCSWFH